VGKANTKSQKTGMGKEQEKGETSLNSKNNRSNPKKEKKKEHSLGKRRWSESLLEIIKNIGEGLG
jgi:hypothetical protein